MCCRAECKAASWRACPVLLLTRRCSYWSARGRKAHRQGENDYLQLDPLIYDGVVGELRRVEHVMTVDARSWCRRHRSGERALFLDEVKWAILRSTEWARACLGERGGESSER